MVEAPEQQRTGSPLDCYTDEEWEDYRSGLEFNRGLHYASRRIRRRYSITDQMVSACLDCPIDYQREMMLAGRCHPPAHIRPITPFERTLDNTAAAEEDEKW